MKKIIGLALSVFILILIVSIVNYFKARKIDNPPETIWVETYYTGTEKY